jgi:hypothetical protein
VARLIDRATGATGATASQPSRNRSRKTWLRTPLCNHRATIAPATSATIAQPQCNKAQPCRNHSISRPRNRATVPLRGGEMVAPSRASQIIRSATASLSPSGRSAMRRWPAEQIVDKPVDNHLARELLPQSHCGNFLRAPARAQERVGVALRIPSTSRYSLPGRLGRYQQSQPLLAACPIHIELPCGIVVVLACSMGWERHGKIGLGETPSVVKRASRKGRPSFSELTPGGEISGRSGLSTTSIPTRRQFRTLRVAITRNVSVRP